MTAALKQELERAAEPKPQQTIRELIERYDGELQKSLGTPDAAQALMRHYLTALRLNPKLLECTAESLLAGLLLSAQVGLEPGPLGHVYLVPFKSECVWMLGYTGIVHLARDGGAQGLRATVVRERDTYLPPWENEKGLHWTWEPADGDAGERVAVLVTWKDGTERVALHCPASRIDKALASSPMKDKSRREEDWYWRKTGIRFARPWLPISGRLAQAINADDSVMRRVEPDETGAAQPVVETVDVAAVEASDDE